MNTSEPMQILIVTQATEVAGGLIYEPAKSRVCQLIDKVDTLIVIASVKESGKTSEDFEGVEMRAHRRKRTELDILSRYTRFFIQNRYATLFKDTIK